MDQKLNLQLFSFSPVLSYNRVKLLFPPNKNRSNFFVRKYFPISCCLLNFESPVNVMTHNPWAQTVPSFSLVMADRNAMVALTTGDDSGR